MGLICVLHYVYHTAAARKPTRMHYAFPFLPIELQTSINEMIALGVPQSAVDLLVERASKAIEAKTISAQRDVIEIEAASNTRVDQISARLEERLRTIMGDTNGMLADTHTIVQNTEAAVTGLRAEFHDGLSAIGERVTDNTARIEDLERKVGEHDQSRDQSIEERKLLREDMNESKAHRGRIQERLDTDLPAIFKQLGDLSLAVERMEQALALAGNHHDDAGGGVDG